MWDERIERDLEEEPVGPCGAAVLGPEGGRVFGSPGHCLQVGSAVAKLPQVRGSGIKEGRRPVGVKPPSPWTGVQGEGSLPGAWGVKIADVFRRRFDVGLEAPLGGAGGV